MKQGSAIRGTIYGILFTIPIWALIIWGVRSWFID
ncbi:hypothetical protein SAMN04488602_101717 [Paenibacillus sp. cl123]|nr:hypothetical protein SAMN04488602_101717 [Paenibacillus sp. cl123]